MTPLERVQKARLSLTEADFEFDTLFRQGSTHDVCQDYAEQNGAAELQDRLLALSDGCSSSPNTDVGARLLVWNALHAGDVLQCTLTRSHREFLLTRTSPVREQARTMGLSQRALDATLLTLGPRGYDDTIDGVLWGDGCFLHGRVWEFPGAQPVGTVTGVALVLEVNSPTNTPAYLSYCQTPDFPFYMNSEHARVEVRSIYYTRVQTPHGPTWVRTSGAAGLYTFNEAPLPGSEVEWPIRLHFHFGMVTQGVGVSYSLPHNFPAPDGSLPAQSLCLTLGFSDGIQTVTDASGKPVGWDDLVPELMSVKSTRGVFLQRRINRMFASRKWTHADDLSAVGIAVRLEIL